MQRLIVRARAVSKRDVSAILKTSSRQFSSPPDDYFNRPGPWDNKDLGSLLTANKAWAQRMVHQQPDFFKEIKRGHAPKILWIGCSDARVPANEIIGEPPGSVFVHRNIANMVVNTDFNCMSVIQFAVSVLKVKHIIVCGHYDCGGIKASLHTNDYSSPLCNWVRNIRDTYRLHRDELNAIPDARDRQRRLVELNVVEQVSIHEMKRDKIPF
jgi:carbonic anhydrase